MYIQGKFKYYTDDISDVFMIRRKVFVEEQGIPEEDEFDELDKEALFCVVYETQDNTSEMKNTVATARLIKLDGTSYKIGRVAVLKEFRGRDYGDMAVRMLVNKALMAGAESIYVSAQTRAAGFYEKIGFHTFGEPYLEDGIEHIGMILHPGEFCSKCHADQTSV